jgi:hypothetical protein
MKRKSGRPRHRGDDKIRQASSKKDGMFPLNQGFLTWGPRTPKGSVDRFHGVRDLGWEKNYIFIFTNL